MFKKILLPIDLAEPEMTRQAIDEAIALAGADGQLRLVTVINAQWLELPIFIDFVRPNSDAPPRLAAEQEIEDVAAKIAYPRERVSTAVRFGAVYDEALAEAADWGADLIVLCSVRPSMATYLLGSNAAAIVRHATCSVLVVRR